MGKYGLETGIQEDMRRGLLDSFGSGIDLSRHYAAVKGQAVIPVQLNITRDDNLILER